MKQSKSILLIILAIVMSLVLVAGCTPKVTDPASSEPASQSESQAPGDSSEEPASSDETSEEPASSDEASDDPSGTTPSSTAPSSTAPSSQAPTTAPSQSTAYSGSTGIKVDPSQLTGRVTDLKGRTIRININQAINYETADGQARKATDEAIEELYNCTIEYRLQHNETGGNYEIVNSVLAGKPLVDIWVQNGWLEVMPHYRAGVIQGLDKLRVFDWSEYSNMITLTRFGDQQYTVTTKINPISGMGANYTWVTYVMWYNQKLLDDYGISDDIHNLSLTGQWTWDKWASIAKKFNQNSAGVGELRAYYDWNFAYDMLLGSYKADWVARDPVTGNYSFSAGTTNAQAALTKYKDLVTEGAITIDPTSGALDARFGKGEAAFLIRQLFGMRWGFGDTGTADVKANWGVSTMPALNSGVNNIQAISLVDAGGYAIPVGVTKPNEVATIMDKWFEAWVDYDDARDSFVETNVIPQLNIRNGDKTLEMVDLLWDICAQEKDFRLYSNFTIHTIPGIGNWTVGNNDSWYTHTRAIAKGEEAMGATITAMTPFYNNILSEFTKTR